MANRIILKRNVGVTGPTGGQLVPGEPAIAMDGPTGANSKLYVGIADTITGSVDNVVAVGGGYYTAFVDDIYSKKSIIQGTEQSFTTALRSKITGNEAAIAAITGAYVTGGNVSQFANDAGYLSTHDHNTVDSFNGATGAVIGVSSVAGLTGTPNASAVRTAIDVDEIYTKKSIIEGTEQSFTTALKNKLDAIEASADVTDVTNVKAAGALIGTSHNNYVISVNGATGAISAATGGGNISQFSNDSSYLTGFTITTVANGGTAVDISITDDTDGNPPSNPRINELTFEAGDGINLFLYKITGDAGGGVPANTAGAKVHIQNDLSSTAFLKSGGVQQQNTNPILHVNGTIDIVGAEVDIGAAAFVGFSTTGKVTGNLPVDGDGVFGGIIEAAGVSGTGRITGSNIPSTIVTGGNVSQFANDAVYLTASNNLSDVTASDARTNLDLDEIHGKKSLIEGMEQSFTTALKNKLDGIEAGADVTDATNVTSAGALMDSELTSIADVKALDQSVISGASPTFNTTNFTDASNKRLMTDAQESKLDGIEAGADVTDATNVAAANVAGAGFVTGTLDFAINGNDEEISKVKLKDYGETIHYIGTSSSPTFNFENGNVQHCTGSSGIGGGNSITLSNPPPNGVAGTMTVICINCGLIPNAGAFWPSAIKWPGGIAPTLSSSGTDIFSVMTHDGGATYYGFMGGMQFS